MSIKDTKINFNLNTRSQDCLGHSGENHNISEVKGLYVQEVVSITYSKLSKYISEKKNQQIK